MPGRGKSAASRSVVRTSTLYAQRRLGTWGRAVFFFALRVSDHRSAGSNLKSEELFLETKLLMRNFDLVWSTYTLWSCARGFYEHVSSKPIVATARGHGHVGARRPCARRRASCTQMMPMTCRRRALRPVKSARGPPPSFMSCDTEPMTPPGLGVDASMGVARRPLASSRITRTTLGYYLGRKFALS